MSTQEKVAALKDNLTGLEKELAGLRADEAMLVKQILEVKRRIVAACSHISTKTQENSWTNFSNGQGSDYEVYYDETICTDCGEIVIRHPDKW